MGTYSDYFNITYPDRGADWLSHYEDDVTEKLFQFLKVYDQTSTQFDAGDRTDDGQDVVVNSASYGHKVTQSGAGKTYYAAGTAYLQYIEVERLTRSGNIQILPSSAAAGAGATFDVNSSYLRMQTSQTAGFYLVQPARVQNISIKNETIGGTNYNRVEGETNVSILINGFDGGTATNEIILMPTINSGTSEEGVSIKRASATAVLFKAFQDMVSAGNTNTLANLQIQASTTYFDTSGQLIIGDTMIVDGEISETSGAADLILNTTTGLTINTNTGVNNYVKISPQAGSGNIIESYDSGAADALFLNTGQVYVDQSSNMVIGGTLSVVGKSDFSTAGFKTKKSTANVSDPPTDAEIDSAFGAPATVGAGFMGVIDDNDGGVSGDVWLCWTTGTDAEWFYVSMTKAT